MNVDQLIKRLQMYPPDLRVVVRRYEGGYNDVDTFEKYSRLCLTIIVNGIMANMRMLNTLYGNNPEKLKTTAVDALHIG
jgi:hypothetical protein